MYSQCLTKPTLSKPLYSLLCVRSPIGEYIYRLFRFVDLASTRLSSPPPPPPPLPLGIDTPLVGLGCKHFETTGSPSVQFQCTHTHARTHTHAHTHTHTRTHARTHARTHTRARAHPGEWQASDTTICSTKKKKKMKKVNPTNAWLALTEERHSGIIKCSCAQLSCVVTSEVVLQINVRGRGRRTILITRWDE